jgi:hypothetical protein
MYRMLMLIAAGSIVTNCLAQNAGDTVSPPANLHPPINLDADTLRARLVPGQFGLKPPTSNLPAGITLPFGIDYHRETKGLVMPLDQKSEWGVGVGLNLNSSSIVELSPSSVLGLTPKRAPGVMLNKKF